MDITPRRCRKFKPAAGEKLRWTNTLPDGKTVQSGTAEADRWGLVTLKGVTISKQKHRIAIAK